MNFSSDFSFALALFLLLPYFLSFFLRFLFFSFFVIDDIFRLVKVWWACVYFANLMPTIITINYSSDFELVLKVLPIYTIPRPNLDHSAVNNSGCLAVTT